MKKYRLLAIVEYDGTDFAGFQVQARSRTVQGELERSLHKITGEQFRMVGAGRTDTGVHASGQGAHFDTCWNKPIPILQRALNALLPNDIAVRSLVKVSDDFSARYSAKSRTYRYTILNRAIRSPLAERFTLWVREPLDAAAMNSAARLLIGQQDFGAFGSPPRGDNTIREILRAQAIRSEDRVIIEIEANAFLYRMMRRLVGTLLLVGKGKLPPAEIRQVVAKKLRAGQSVPPQGLCLIEVKY
jgi:tRNA pseudouridine38-40 synthase